MHTSAARVEVDSQRCNGYCKISINLWKCGSCSRPLFTTFFTVRDPCDLKHLAKHMDCIQKVWKFYCTSDDSLHTVKSVSDNTISSTTPDVVNSQDLMDKVADSIEELDIQMYQIISSKAKLDDIFERLEKLNQIGETVVVPISAKIARLERSISNSGVTPYLDSVQEQLNSILLILPDQDHE